MIRKFGARCVLRRVATDPIAPGDRNCIAAEVEFDSREKQGQLVNPTDRLFLVSALNLSVPPDQFKDTLVTFVPKSNPPVEFEHLKITRTPGRLAPAQVVVYWELQARG